MANSVPKRTAPGLPGACAALSFHRLEEALLKLRDARSIIASRRSEHLGNFDSDGRVLLLEPLGEALVNYSQTNGVNEWGCAVSVITIESLASILNANWPVEFWKHFVPEAFEHARDAVPATLAILDSLYSKAQKPIASPLHFFLIAEACKLLKDIVSRTRRANIPSKTDERSGIRGAYHLDEYFNTIELALEPNKRTRTYHIVGLPGDHKEDWFFRYLANQLSIPADSQDSIIPPAQFLTGDKGLISAISSWTWDLLRRTSAAGGKMAIIGPPNSGKRTVLKLWESAADKDVQVGPHFNYHQDAGGVRLHFSDDRSLGIETFCLERETRVGDSDKRKIVESTTLVFVIPSCSFHTAERLAQDEILTPSGTQLVKRILDILEGLQLGRKKAPQYSIAFAYTMSDDFGVVIPNDQVRILESGQDWQNFIKYTDNNKHRDREAAWNTFVSEVERANSPEDIRLLRRMLLNGTRSLWQTVARDFDKGRAVVNGYIVQSKPVLNASQSRRNWKSDGSLAMLADELFEE